MMRICSVLTSEDGTLLRVRVIHEGRRFTIKPKNDYDKFVSFVNSLTIPHQKHGVDLSSLMERTSYHHANTTKN